MRGLRFINDKYARHPLISHWKEEKQCKVFFFVFNRKFSIYMNIHPLCLCTIKISVNSAVKNLVDKCASELQNCNMKCHREYYNAQQRKVFLLQIRH